MLSISSRGYEVASTCIYWYFKIALYIGTCIAEAMPRKPETVGMNECLFARSQWLFFPRTVFS